MKYANKFNIFINYIFDGGGGKHEIPTIPPKGKEDVKYIFQLVWLVWRKENALSVRNYILLSSLYPDVLTELGCFSLK